MTDNEYRRLILSTRAAIILPALWSVVTGGLAGAFTALMLMALGKDNPQTGGLLVGSGASLITWFTAMIWWLRQWRRVRAPHVAPPAVPVAPPKTRIEVHEHDNRVIRMDDLPIEYDKFRIFAGWVRADKAINYADLSSLFGGDRVAVNKFRDALIDRGYMRWRNAEVPTLGVVITQKGKRILPHLAQAAHDNDTFTGRTHAHTQGDDE